jgi:large subunit ribosomal protein L25
MKVVATTRPLQGTSASRRLRHAGKVPGILYGGKGTPVQLEIEHNPLYHALRVEAFHASILDMEIDGESQRVLLRHVQWHPYKQQVLHIDFQRVEADSVIQMKVPLHFVNAENSPAVKQSAAILTHVITEVRIACLPADLPEFIEVDLIALEATQNVHIKDVKFPAGVTPVLRRNENPSVITITIPPPPEATPVAAATPAKGKGKK